jgi:hypothetical protein
MEANPIILFECLEIKIQKDKTQKVVMLDDEPYTKEMSLEEANAYYRQIALSKPEKSYFSPVISSGYIYNKATNSLIENKQPEVVPPVVAPETVGKNTTGKKGSDTTTV